MPNCFKIHKETGYVNQVKTLSNYFLNFYPNAVKN